MLAGLPGETLAKLASRTTRRELRPGEEIVETEADRTRFYVVISGMLQATSGVVLRPGDTAGGPTPLTGRIQAMLPSTVASCDRATFDELIAPAISENRA
jgi:CRP-like cAMP-binding protein